MKKSLVLVSSILVLGSGVMRCSSNNPVTDAGPDTGKPDVVKPDVGQPDNYVPVVTPAGTELASSSKIIVFGISDDDQVIYADKDQNFALFAVDVAGGTPTKIASPAVTSSTAYNAGIAGKVVFVWEGISSAANAPQVGTLHLWMKGGSYVLAMPSDAGTGKSCASTGFAASADNTKVIFSANSNNTCTLGDIVGANSDGTSPSTLAASVDLGTDCSPLMGFAGTHGVTATCATAPGDGGTPSATVKSFDTTASWAAATIITGALDVWATDTAGDHLLVATPTGTQVFPIAGGGGTTIDTKNIGNNAFAYMTKDGTHVLYTTPANDIWRAASTSPSNPAALQTTGVKVVRSYSADENYFIYSTNFDAQNFGSDLFLASMTATGTPVTLVSGTTGSLFGLRFSDDFTTDSKYTVFIENVDTNQGIGDLYAVPVAGGSPAKITTAEWQNISATGSKIVFNDNCQGCSGTSTAAGGTADIKWADLSTTTAPAMLQAGADVSIYISKARDHVIYTFSTNPPADDGGVQGNGLYAVAIP